MDENAQQFNDVIGSIWNLFDGCCVGYDDLSNLSFSETHDLNWKQRQAYNASLLQHRISNTPKLDMSVKQLALQWTSHIVPAILFDPCNESSISRLQGFHLQVKSAIENSQHSRRRVLKPLPEVKLSARTSATSI